MSTRCASITRSRTAASLPGTSGMSSAVPVLQQVLELQLGQHSFYIYSN